MTMSKHRGAAAFVTVSLLAVALWGPTAARADGALAVGFPADVSKDGFAYGFSVEQANKDDAKEAALKACRNTTAAPQSAKVLCMVVGTFSNECVAIAMDPKAGTPGVGFAIASNQETAEERALAFCAATEGADRRGSCKIDKSSCDKRQP
jgi:hypothetical protein